MKNNAEQTYFETKNVIKNLDNEMKLSPLIDKGDMENSHFNNFNISKKKMKEMQWIISKRRLVYFCIGLISLVVVFMIIHRSEKVEDIVMDEKDAI